MKELLKSLIDKISRRRRQLLVHSFLYYQLNENIIADETFDLWSKELVELQKLYPEAAKQAVYAEEFASFDGSSGYDLPYHLPEIQNTGFKLLELHRKRKTGV